MRIDTVEEARFVQSVIITSADKSLLIYYGLKLTYLLFRFFVYFYFRFYLKEKFRIKKYSPLLKHLLLVKKMP